MKPNIATESQKLLNDWDFEAIANDIDCTFDRSAVQAMTALFGDLIGEVEKQTKEIEAMQKVIKDQDEIIDSANNAIEPLNDELEYERKENERLRKALEQIKTVTSNSAAYTDGAKAHYIADQALRRDTQ